MDVRGGEGGYWYMKKKGGGMFLPVMIDMLKPQEIILKLSTNPFNKERGGAGGGEMSRI